jgi:AraC-like DNA-binding protein
LRVLIVVGNDPADDMIQAEDELLAIEAAAQSKNDEVLLRALIRPKPEDIKEALLKFRPHIFHFIGHGVLGSVWEHRMSGESLSTAAHAAGFADSAHLTRTSRRMIGIPPSLMDIAEAPHGNQAHSSLLQE